MRPSKHDSVKRSLAIWTPYRLHLAAPRAIQITFSILIREGVSIPSESVEIHYTLLETIKIEFGKLVHL